MKMRASIAKLGVETRSFTAREFADKLAEVERIGATAIRNRDQNRLTRGLPVILSIMPGFCQHHVLAIRSA
jgi:hypothetical protein